MKSKPTKRRPVTKQVAVGADEIAEYAKSLKGEYAAICRALRAEIEEVLPKAVGKIWHGSPVWFVGENPVVGYNVTAKKGINLLFWNGQAFQEPALQPAGKFRAAQIQFTEVASVDQAVLRRWLKKAGQEIWDYRGYFLAQKALQKKRKLKP